MVALGNAPDGAMRIVTLPHGAVLELAGEPQKSGLVDVMCGGRHLTVFIQDIDARAEVFS